MDNVVDEQCGLRGHSDTCHAGHLEPEGEAGRVVLLPVEIDTEKLKSIIPDIVFDIHQLK